MSWLTNILKVALPAVGTIIAPGIGTVLGGAAGAAIGGAESAGKASKNRQAATDLSMQAYNQKAPLRSKYLEQALKGPQQAPNLSRLFNGPGNAANPFFRPTNPATPPVATPGPVGIGGVMGTGLHLTPDQLAALRGLAGQPGTGVGPWPNSGPQVALPSRPTPYLT